MLRLRGIQKIPPVGEWQHLVGEVGSNHHKVSR